MRRHPTHADSAQPRLATRTALLCLVVVALIASGCSGDDAENALGVDPEVFLPTSLEGISNAVDVSVGGTHACAVLEDGSVACWGSNGDGQLGDDTFVDSRVPVAVTGIANAESVSASASHSCAVLDDGAVACWGRNGSGQLGDGTSMDSGVPVAVEGISNATDVSATGGGLGDAYTCAVLDDGTISCWGHGWGDPVSRLDSRRPMPVEGISNAVAVSAARFCALLDDGTVSCWERIGGVLDDGTPVESPPPEAVPGIANATALSGDGTCALLEDGTVTCREDGEWSPVEEISDAIAISDSCAVLEGGSVSCWRNNGEEDRDSGDSDDQEDDSDARVAVEVEDVSNATAVSSNGEATLDMSCVVEDAGSVVCWGFGAVRNTLRDSGTLDDPIRRPNPPAPVEGIDTATALSLDTYRACVVLDDGTVTCWMMSAYGDGVDTPPATVEGISGATGVSVRSHGACAVLGDGTVRCWDIFSEDGSTATTTPLAVPDISNSRSVDGRCALLDDGTRKCWKSIFEEDPDGTQGALIDIQLLDVSSGPSDVTAFSGGCFVLADRSVACWDEDEELVPIKNISNATALSHSDRFGCALLETGGVSCWGVNFHGQRGDGIPRGGKGFTEIDDHTATNVVGISTATSVATASGWGHACATLADGSALCWGHNESGELGDGTFGERRTPAAVKGVSDVVSVAIVEPHSCALIADGTVTCWGNTDL